MMLHPGRGIGDLGKARRMTLGKTIAAKAFDLLEGAFGKIPEVARDTIPFTSLS